MFNKKKNQNLEGKSAEGGSASGGEEKSEFAKIYEESIKKIDEGQVVKGKIIMITQKDVIVDIGYKSEGRISLEEFLDASTLKIGDEIEVYLESKEDESGTVVVSKRKADKTQGWDSIIARFNEGDTIQGKIVKSVKGGFMVDIGTEAFLPASQSAIRGAADAAGLIGKVSDFKILKINKQRKNIVVSRKDILLKEKEATKLLFLEELKKGEIRQGVVKNITDFGAFISIGPIDGLLHITDMSWGRINHPSEMVAVGDKIDIMILEIDKQSLKVSLGLKQTTPSPWKDAEAKYTVGSKVKGKVVNIVPYGAFVELEKGIEGLVHVSELSWTKRINHPSEVLAIGDVVEVVVLSIDAENEKISLGVKQTEQNPWLEAAAKYPIGTKVSGKVRNFTDFGAFIELDEGIEGLVHLSDISWTKKINHPSEVLKKAQKVDVVILDVDQQARKISLGLKQMTQDPWSEMSKKYAPGTPVEGQVTKITGFGIFVELEPELEGLIHISELSIEPSTKLEEKFKVGDKVKAKVIKVDDEQRKIALTTKDA